MQRNANSSLPPAKPSNAKTESPFPVNLPPHKPQRSRISRVRTTGGSATALVFLAAGCAIGPDYKRPAEPTPAKFRGATMETTNSLADLPWWGLFRDPELQPLISDSLTNNFDLQRAIARVEQARNQAIVSRAPLFPAVGYQGTIARGENSSLGSPVPNGGLTQTTPMMALQASWEVDLWGRLRRLNQAGQAQYLATEQARRGVMLTVVSDVAVTYYQLLELDEEVSIQKNATNAFTETLRIFQDRLDNGVASRLETDRAEAALATAAAAVPDLERRTVQTENALNLLLGRPPGPVKRGLPLSQQFSPPEIPAGLPSTLLQRRPDILQAEQELVAANAIIGARLADFFPKIGLTTMFGGVNNEVNGFLSRPALMWSAAASASGPIFNAGAINARYQGAKAQFDEVKAVYGQTVVNSFKEVSDALVARQKFGEMRVQLERAVTALTSSVKISTERYINGKSSYFEVLQAQQELYPQQRALAQARFGEYVALIQLYRVLGGGWNLTDAQWLVPADDASSSATKP
jgi:multidrug efflux system outer membrane protein